MTESFKTMFMNAKSIDEAYDLVCAHENEFTMAEQIKIFQAVTGRTELTDEELDMVIGGSLWSSIKKAASKVASAVSSAATSVANWVVENKAVVIGAVAGVVVLGVGLATGFIVAETVADAALGGVVFAGLGALAGKILG